jgi:protein O-mannosyl-transferase
MNLSDKTGRTVLICALLSAVTLATYWPVTAYNFVNYDDNVFVTQNPHVAGGWNRANVVWAFRTGLGGNWQPLTCLSHMLDALLFGLRPGWHHLSSLLFHTANGALLFLLLQRMTGAAWRSAGAAALFALHPLHVESVAWVAERKDVLSGLFFMLTLGAYVRYAEERRAKSEGREPKAEGRPKSEVRRPKLGPASYYGLALAFDAMGLMSKPMLVTLPFVLLLLDWWPLQRWQPAPSNLKPAARKFRPSSFILHPLLLEKLPFLALAAVSCVATLWAQSAGGAVSSLARVPLELRVANALVAYATYLVQTFWPAGLAIFYPLRGQLPSENVAGACVLLWAITAWAVLPLLRWRRGLG